VAERDRRPNPAVDVVATRARRSNSPARVAERADRRAADEEECRAADEEFGASGPTVHAVHAGPSAGIIPAG
jgi:hypothetical protein